ncbi:MAG TPA: transcriptional regulator [Galbitalea sp.]
MSAEPASHPRHDFDELLNSPTRLSILAALSRLEDVEFQILRDSLEVSDSVLSKQATLLEAAGYIRIRKGYVGKRPRTWLSITAGGRAGFARHVAALHAVLGEG